MLFLILSFLLFQTNEVIIESIEKDDVKISFIELNSDQKIRLEAVAARVTENTHSESYIWILDSKTREVVWQLDEASYSSRDEALFEYYDSFFLKKGIYEIHFSTVTAGYRVFSSHWDIFSVELASERINQDAFREMNLIVMLKDGGEISEELARKYQFGEENSVLYSKKARDNQTVQKIGFELKADCEFMLYTIGEVDHDEVQDYAWLTNLEKHKTVWKMTYKSSIHAGGAEKNRSEKVKLKLKKGNYILTYVTDERHSPNSWNDAIPFDVNMYGVTLYVANEDKRKIVLSEADEMELEEPVIKLSRLRNNDFKSHALHFERSSELRLLAIGEMNDDEEMLDFSWIENLKTNEVVWKMTAENTRPAGGDERNRLFDNLIELPRGDYVVYSATNSSHAYNNWIYERPYEGKNWGITVFPQDKSAVRSFNLEKKRDYLVSMTRFPNSSKEKESFSLDKESFVSIYALGEANNREMSDYGFIRDDKTERVVWRMKFENTKHAGGSRRNRMYRGKILLDKGDYTVYFKTDLRHAFGAWKDEAPYNLTMYGITIFKDKD